MMDPLSTIGDVEARIRALEMRIQELEETSRDAFDLSITTPIPSVLLSPPETPQAEVFGGSGGSGIFPGAIQIEEDENGLYLVQKWCKAKGNMFEFVELKLEDDDDLGTDEEGNAITYSTLGGPGCTTKYATRIKLYSHAADHSEGVIKPWSETKDDEEGGTTENEGEGETTEEIL
jgi:hypothetical protein